MELQRRLGAVGDTTSLMRTLGLETVREAKQRTRAFRKTGDTGRSIRLSRSDRTRALVIAGGASVFLERGTKAHKIRVRRARALRFAVKGAPVRLSGSPRRGAAVVFARSVQHPGTQKQPFMVPAAREVLLKRGIPGKSIRVKWDQAA